MKSNKKHWVDVKGFCGLYKINNLGEVKSLDRIIIRNNKRSLKIKERILSQWDGGDGYLRVQMSKDGVSKSYKVHQLMAINFLGHNPNGYKLVVDHINNKRGDNRLENLQIVTPRVNVSKDRVNGTSKYTGVCWCKRSKKWMSSITINGKQKFLGYFDCEINAANAYNKSKSLCP